MIASRPSGTLSTSSPANERKKKETAEAVSFTVSSGVKSEQGDRFVVHGVDVVGTAGRDQLDQTVPAALDLVHVWCLHSSPSKICFTLRSVWL